MKAPTGPTAPTRNYIWSYINRSVYCYRKQAWIGHTWIAIGTQWSQLGPAATLNDSADAIRYKMATLIACFPSDVESAPFPIAVSNSIGNGNWKHPFPRPSAVETTSFPQQVAVEMGVSNSRFQLNWKRQLETARFQRAEAYLEFPTS